MRTGCCTLEVLTLPESRGKEAPRLIPALLGSLKRLRKASGRSLVIGAGFGSHKGTKGPGSARAAP
jgi:hypothetical protein